MKWRQSREGRREADSDELIGKSYLERFPGKMHEFIFGRNIADEF